MNEVNAFSPSKFIARHQLRLNIGALRFGLAHDSPNLKALLIQSSYRIQEIYFGEMNEVNAFSLLNSLPDTNYF